jgi:integration host factor subunit beta
MVKSELVQKLCNMHPNILRKDIEKIIQTLIEEIIQALCKNKAVEIRGWGRFKTVIRKARVGRNPKSAQIIKIPEKKAIKWKMSKILYNKINQSLKEQETLPN